MRDWVADFQMMITKSLGLKFKTIEEVYDISEMIIKVKEPLKKEYSLIKEGQIIYTFFHFASSKELTQAMIDSNSICIVYETVENLDGSLPTYAYV